jgi:DNA invertase Pin-like site-specific DNA recombinase
MSYKIQEYNMSSNNRCIIYCRQSKADSETPLSLDSQEYANKEYMKSNNMRLYKVVKDIGSAFSKPNRLEKYS